MNAPETIRLTEFSHGGGCGCKIAPAGRGAEVLPEWKRKLLSDPQTSGGLLVACASEAVSDVLGIFADQGFPEARVIGKLAAGPARLRVV